MPPGIFTPINKHETFVGSHRAHPSSPLGLLQHEVLRSERRGKIIPSRTLKLRAHDVRLGFTNMSTGKGNQRLVMQGPPAHCLSSSKSLYPHTHTNLIVVTLHPTPAATALPSPPSPGTCKPHMRPEGENGGVEGWVVIYRCRGHTYTCTHKPGVRYATHVECVRHSFSPIRSRAP